MADGKKSLGFGGDWTAEKLERVRKYLSAYTTALKNQPFRLVYIDAFAGTGYYGRDETPDIRAIPELEDSETQAFLKGSARIALEVNPRFDEFVFVDRNPRHCAELSTLGDEYPHLKSRMSVVNADANAYLQELTARDWIKRKERGVLFLDPYATQVDWQTVQAVA